jgi:hypothetical protein
MENVLDLIFENIYSFNTFTSYLNKQNYFFINLISNLERTFFSKVSINDLSYNNEHIVTIKDYDLYSFYFSYLYNNEKISNKKYLFIKEIKLDKDYALEKKYAKKLIKKELLKINIFNF